MTTEVIGGATITTLFISFAGGILTSAPLISCITLSLTSLLLTSFSTDCLPQPAKTHPSTIIASKIIICFFIILTSNLKMILN